MWMWEHKTRKILIIKWKDKFFRCYKELNSNRGVQIPLQFLHSLLMHENFTRVRNFSNQSNQKLQVSSSQINISFFMSFFFLLFFRISVYFLFWSCLILKMCDIRIIFRIKHFKTLIKHLENLKRSTL